MIKGIIFDFGNVIGTKKKSIYDIISEESKLDYDYIKKTIKDIIHKSQIHQIEPEEFWKEIDLAIKTNIKNDYRKLSEKLDECTFNQEVVDIIKNLNNYKKGMISNFSNSYQERNTDIDYLFDVITISSKIGYRKPEKEIYNLTLEKLSLQPKECIYIDDQEKYVEASKKLGMHGITYKDAVKLKEELKNNNIFF